MVAHSSNGAGPEGPGAAKSTPDRRPSGSRSDAIERQTGRYITTLLNIEYDAVVAAQTAWALGKTERAESLTAASQFKTRRAEAALRVRDANDPHAAAAELVAASEAHRQAMPNPDDPEAAAEFEGEDYTLKSMAEAGAYVLDLIHPLPDHRRWIDTLSEWATPEQPTPPGAAEPELPVASV